MADMDEYSRLMRGKREGTSFTSSPLVRPEVIAAAAEDPEDETIPFEDDVRSIGRGAKAVYDILDKYSTKALTYPARVAADPVGEARKFGLAAADAQEALANLGKAAASGDPKAIRDSADIASMVPGTGPIPEITSGLASFTMAGQDVAEGRDPKENVLWGALTLATVPFWWLGASELKQASKAARKTARSPEEFFDFRGGQAPPWAAAATKASKRQNVVDHKFADEYDAQLAAFRAQDEKLESVANEKLAEGWSQAKVDEILSPRIQEIARGRRAWLDDWTERYTSGRARYVPESKRKAMHEAENARRVARGEEPVPYQAAPAYGMAGAMEEALPQKMGGDIKITGRKGSRSPTREDELRDESRQVVAQTGAEAKFRKMTPSERKQYEELGEITRRDPNAPVVPIVDDSGKLIAGKGLPVRQAKDVTDPYPEGTAEAIAGQGLPVQASKGGKVVGKPREAKGHEGRGLGTEGMPESLLRDLSLIAQKEFPGAGGVLPQSRHFDNLTAAQQQTVLSKARETPTLSRALDVFERRKAEAAAKAPTGTGRSTKASRARMAEAAKKRKEGELADKTRRELQKGLKGKRKATGTTQMLRKRAAREASQEGLPTAEFLKDVTGMTTRYSGDQIKFIQQVVKSGDMAPVPANLELLDGFLTKVDVLYQPNIRQYILVEKVSKRPVTARALRDAIEPYPPDVTRAAIPRVSARVEPERTTYAQVVKQFDADTVIGRHQPSVPVERVTTPKPPKPGREDVAKAAKERKKKLSKPLTVEQLAEGGKFELYVGSPKSFTEFRPSSTGQFGSGVYLSVDPETARGCSLKEPKDAVFGGSRPESGNLMTVEVDIKNPLSLHAATLTSSERKNWIRALKKHGRTKELEMLESEKANPSLIYESLLGGGIGQSARVLPAFAEKAKRIAQDAGYDSIIGKPQAGWPAEVVVFDPANIKIKSTEKISRKVEAVKPPQPPVTVAEPGDGWDVF